MGDKKKRARRSFGGRSQTQKESKKKRKRQESNPASPSLETPSNLDIQIDVTNTVVDQLLLEHQNEPFFLTVWFFLIFFTVNSVEFCPGNCLLLRVFSVLERNSNSQLHLISFNNQMIPKYWPYNQANPHSIEHMVKFISCKKDWLLTHRHNRTILVWKMGRITCPSVTTQLTLLKA